MRRAWSGSARLTAALLAVGVVASCTSGSGGAPRSTGSSTTRPSSGPASSASSVSPVPSVSPQPTAAGLPACTVSAAAAARALPTGSVRRAAVPDSPWGVSVTPDGRWAFVALPYQVEVLAGSARGFRVVHSIALPTALPAAAGTTLTADGRLLLVAAGSGAAVLGVAAAESGSAQAVLGTLTDGDGQDAVEVTTSRDGRYAFVSREYANDIVVFDLAAAVRSHFAHRAPIGSVVVGRTVVGSALSADGRILYVTSEGGAVDGGLLTMLDVRRLESTPERALLASVPAGCDPVRVLPSPDGRTVWVTARESNSVLAFDARGLATAPTRTRPVVVRVGTAPVGLAFFRHGSRLLVAQSNRFSASGGTGSLLDLDTAAALAGRPALLGTLPAGVFPREIGVAGRSGVALVSDYGSDQLQFVDTGALP